MTSRALLIGVPTTSEPGFPELPDAGGDVAELAALVCRSGFAQSDVDKRPGGCGVVELKSALFDLRAKTHAGDLAVVYFTGHGFNAPDMSEQPDERFDQSLVLSDGILRDDWFRKTFWPFIAAGSRWLTFADCCFSASVFMGVEAPVPIQRPTLALPTPSGTWRLHLAAARDEKSTTTVDAASPGYGRARSYATAAVLQELHEQPMATYRRLMDAVEADANRLYAGSLHVGVPVRVNVSVNDQLLDSPAFRPLTW